ncbi:putative E3 ubiquitin-protein ligase UBR7 [Metopolophium dirhodum]|uniref:putative E3 ubiquitin-protein ligase UBR7 n=1 Tax=Metopolophium dirhodum TaxID=44670 RepID=UPI002990077C|nr:putative E3 ubiquitin-protein ligase UBR7 [Metopolophium dirhodum]
MSESEGNSFNDNEDDQVVGLVEYINDQNAEIEQANLILEASESDSCTYSLGYMNRQALYACLTCTEKDKLPGAICLPCMYECHEDHDLVELWTKRNYRCDCGSDKLTSECKLEPSKPEANDRNVYNQNFKGLYCICQRPYPDSENTDEMVQCIVCEDWYHSKHLGTKDMNPDDYSEMICSGCTSKLSFLPAYNHLIVTDGLVQNIEKDDESEDVDVVDTVKESEDNVENGLNVVSKDMTSDNAKAGTSSGENCKLTNAKDPKKIIGSSFWVEGWRQELCTCSNCIELYKTEGVPFITDQQDTLQAYENKSRERMLAKEKQSEDGLSKALSSMDRVAAVELAHQYNQFKEELGEWLGSFKEDKVVKVEDVQEFFSGMQARKRARTDDGIPPSFCR